MTTYQPNIPTGFVNLDTDYANIQGNFQQLDTTFGIDHYTFSNATANNGFHNKVTTPIFVDNPVTGLPPITTTNPIFYAFQQYAAVGTLQYSRGPSNAIPTPLTKLYSGSAAIVLAPGASTNVLDFTGVTRATCTLYGWDTVNIVSATTIYQVFWTGTTFGLIDMGSLTSLRASSTGNILQLKNFSGSVTHSNVYWALDIQRLD